MRMLLLVLLHSQRHPLCDLRWWRAHQSAPARPPLRAKAVVWHVPVSRELVSLRTLVTSIKSPVRRKAAHVLRFAT